MGACSNKFNHFIKFQKINIIQDNINLDKRTPRVQCNVLEVGHSTQHATPYIHSRHIHPIVSRQVVKIEISGVHANPNIILEKLETSVRDPVLDLRDEFELGEDIEDSKHRSTKHYCKQCFESYLETHGLAIDSFREALRALKVNSYNEAFWKDRSDEVTISVIKGIETKMEGSVLMGANNITNELQAKYYSGKRWFGTGNQFYKGCHIYGTVDFIFGDAAVLFQNCKIFVRPPLKGQSNTISAESNKFDRTYWHVLSKLHSGWGSRSKSNINKNIFGEPRRKWERVDLKEILGSSGVRVGVSRGRIARTTAEKKVEKWFWGLFECFWYPDITRKMSVLYAYISSIINLTKYPVHYAVSHASVVESADIPECSQETQKEKKHKRGRAEKGKPNGERERTDSVQEESMVQLSGKRN
ncbi:hypothetical protein Sjap_010934 [Stephania japonica]|uniref:Pectinesterase n=1 Tax=Stephania japonica TaxID=461633 RepID=A0AAP0P473_9MAGN